MPILCFRATSWVKCRAFSFFLIPILSQIILKSGGNCWLCSSTSYLCSFPLWLNCGWKHAQKSYPVFQQVPCNLGWALPVCLVSLSHIFLRCLKIQWPEGELASKSDHNPLSVISKSGRLWTPNVSWWLNYYLDSSWLDIISWGSGGWKGGKTSPELKHVAFNGFYFSLFMWKFFCSSGELFFF